MTMETIEIPRFLLDYFDSATIRTPLTAIRGYADVMLKEIPGPLTDDQKRYIEIIRNSAEKLNEHFNLVIHNQHYLAWEQQAYPDQLILRDLIKDFEEIASHFRPMSIHIQTADETLPVWGDQRHLHNAFSSIAEYAGQVCDKNKGAVIFLSVFDKAGFVTFSFEISKKETLSKKELSYYESYLFVAQRVMEVHNGNFTLQHESPEKVWITLVLPNIPKVSSR